MNLNDIRRSFFAVAAGLALALAAAAQGIELKPSGTTYFGSAANCTQPASIRFDDVRDATPEWQTIRSEGIRKGSARYSLLISEMNARIQRACRKAAEEAGRDCVVGDRDVKDDRGLEVRDITAEVVARLESGEGSS